MDNVPLVAEVLNKLSEELSLLLYHAGQVPVDSRTCACGTEVADELSTRVGLGANRQVVCHNI
jgi:hypothetical protein